MNYVGLITLIKKELMRFVRVPLQTLGSPVVTTVLYFAVFGAAIGNRIGSLRGLTYAEFIMPGLIMMNVLMVSFMGIASGIMLSKFMQTITDILAAPLSDLEIILGFVISSVIRSVITAAVIYLTALFFMPFRIDHPFYLVTFVALVAFAFSLLGLIVGIWATDFERLSIIPTFLITPLTFLGGVFYSTEMLSPLFRTISHFNPILYTINGMRHGFYGISDVPPLYSFLLIVLMSVGLLYWALHLFKSGYKLRT